MNPPSERWPIAIGITGASGAPYWRRLMELLLAHGEELHLTVSSNADDVCRAELDSSLDETLEQISSDAPGKLQRFSDQDFWAPMASGSARYQGMVVVPCSMGTLARIARGTSSNLLTRAADVMLKERRKLVLVPRETPLSLVHLENMTAVTRAGAVVLPGSPGYYHRPASIDDVVDFVVQRILDQLGLDLRVSRRWGDERQDRV